jgi:hypothetical protein
MNDGAPHPATASAAAPAPGTAGLVAVLSRDLFFGMRIRTSLRQLGYAVAIAQDVPTFSRHLSNGDQRANLGIVDFNFPVDWTAVSDLKAFGVPLLAFGPHKDVDGFRAARAAGVTRTVANGEFSRSLPELARKYATPLDRS